MYNEEMEGEFASSLLETAVREFAKLPGVGRKTALRHVLYLLKQDDNQASSRDMLLPHVSQYK